MSPLSDHISSVEYRVSSTSGARKTIGGGLDLESPDMLPDGRRGFVSMVGPKLAGTDSISSEEMSSRYSPHQ
jgi:hypothetical protein